MILTEMEIYGYTDLAIINREEGAIIAIMPPTEELIWTQCELSPNSRGVDMGIIPWRIKCGPVGLFRQEGEHTIVCHVRTYNSIDGRLVPSVDADRMIACTAEFNE